MKKYLLPFVLIYSFMMSGQCPAPENLTASNITTTSATLSWTSNGTDWLWNLIVLPQGAPAPTPATNGWIPATANPFVVTGLTCYTNYDFYIRSVCGEMSSEWVGPLAFTTYFCDGELPDLYACDINGDMTETVDLSQNDSAALMMFGTTNAEVSYYSSAEDAESQSNPLLPVFTATLMNQELFARVNDNDNPSVFGIYQFEVVMSTSPDFVQPLPQVQCSLDGFANFNLEAVTNMIYQNASVGQMENIVVSYHETLIDAETGTNQVQSPYQNIVAIQQILYIRLYNYVTGCHWISTLQLMANSCNGFSLHAFLDDNENGVMDPGETPFTNGAFVYDVNEVSNNFVASSTGNLLIYDGNMTNSYDISYQLNPEYADYFSSSQTYTDISPNTELVDLYFPITTTQQFVDVAVSIAPVQQPRPGFEYQNIVTVVNNGTIPFNGTLTFSADSAVTILSASPEPTMIPGGFTYEIENLDFLQSIQFLVMMQVPTIPTVEIGQTLTNSVSVASEEDVDQSNNSASIAQVVVGSYDPNDKMESRGRQILIDDFTDEDDLTYTIRFENTGTAEAINVRITDNLDSWLDPESVRMIGASHDYVLTRNGNALEWKFDEIMLPYTSDDPVGSHGYVQFKVRPNAGVTEGVTIPNTASIYFDFNPAIVTNTFVTEFVDLLGVEETTSAAFTVYPNPASNMLHVISSGTDFIKNIQLLDVTGKAILSQTASSAQTSVDISFVSTGLYFLSVELSSGGRSVKKIIIE